MGGMEWYHWLIIAAVFVLLFGYKKLPSASKSVAQSLKIFRDETKSLRPGHDEDPAKAEQSPASAGEHVGGTSTAGAIAAPVVIAAPAQAAAPQAGSAPAQQAPAPQPVHAATGPSLAPKPSNR